MDSTIDLSSPTNGSYVVARYSTAGSSTPADPSMPTDRKTPADGSALGNDSYMQPPFRNTGGPVGISSPREPQIRQEIHRLYQTNYGLRNKLHQASSEREVDLRNKLQQACSERGGFYFALLERDDRIESLEVQSRNTFSLQEQLQATTAECDSLNSMQNDLDDYISCLEAQVAGRGVEIP